MANDRFKNTLKKATTQRNVLIEKSSKAKDWLKSTITEAAKPTPRNVMSKASQQDTAIIGKMFLFAYKPKLAKELPYYDMYPLVFPFALESTGFYGINLHYLPHPYRAAIMDGLLSLVENKTLDQNTKIQLSYNILKSSAKLRYYKPCVKHYLNSGVQSSFALIPADQWEQVLFLPLERFAKASQEQVFADSRRIIRGR